MGSTATLSSTFRISIPKDLCKRQNWAPGQKFAFVPTEGGIMLVPVPTVDGLRGLAMGAATSDYRDREDRT